MARAVAFDVSEALLDLRTPDDPLETASEARRAMRPWRVASGKAPSLS
jgi:hypothetical protein